MSHHDAPNELLNMLSDVTDLIACSASHELNNIFMGISCYLDILMQHQSASDGTSKELLRIKEALRQAQLITGKLGILAGTRDNPLEPDSFQNLTQGACSMIRKGMKRRGIHLIETYDAPKPKFSGKISVFYRFITGTITLLMDLMPDAPSREIHVCLSHDEDRILISISTFSSEYPPLSKHSSPVLFLHDVRIDYYCSLCESIGGHLDLIPTDDNVRFEAEFRNT